MNTILAASAARFAGAQTISPMLPPLPMAPTLDGFVRQPQFGVNRRLQRVAVAGASVAVATTLIAGCANRSETLDNGAKLSMLFTFDESKLTQEQKDAFWEQCKNKAGELSNIQKGDSINCNVDKQLGGKYSVSVQAQRNNNLDRTLEQLERREPVSLYKA